MIVRLISLVVMASLVASATHASVMYRYKDDQGKTVLSAAVPPDVVPRGYEVLNNQGRVIEKVAPALTPEQIKARDEEIARLEREEKIRKAQVEIDQKLLKQYGTPEAARGILERRIEEIDAVIVSRRAAIDAARNAIEVNEERAANFQRNGRQVPARVTKELEKSRQDIVSATNVISEREKAREEVSSEFEGIISRLEFLAGGKAKTLVQP